MFFLNVVFVPYFFITSQHSKRKSLAQANLTFFDNCGRLEHARGLKFWETLSYKKTFHICKLIKLGDCPFKVAKTLGRDYQVILTKKL